MAKSGEGSHIVHLRLTCVTPPLQTCDNEHTEFGLQDRKQVVHPGKTHPDGSVSYEIDVPVALYKGTNAVRFLGPYVHGTPAAPFLYLSLKRLEAGPAPWIRRLKIPLPTLMWNQVEATLETKFFAASISGTSSGTVPLLDRGWTRQNDNTGSKPC